MAKCVILTPFNTCVKALNEKIIEMLDGEEKICVNVDRTDGNN